MNKSEQKQLAVELDSRWPLKYEAPDLKLWASTFEPYAFHLVRDALAKWKNGAKGQMPPKIHEIKALLPEPAKHDQQRAIAERYRSAVARQVIRCKPDLFGQPEVVVLA
jgi:hypothetical protein